MVSSVGNTPYSYLSQLQVNKPAATTAATTTPAATTGSSTSSAQSLVSSLLNNGNGFAPEALSLLQQNSSGSFDPITSLLGGTGTNDALTNLYANLFSTSTSATIAQAKANGATQANTKTAATQTGSAQTLINGLTKATIAYNQTSLQNAANVLKANSYGPDGVTPLVA
jgi:hypothetical protein